MNYLDNSRKLLKLYPKMNTTLLVGKKKEDGESPNLMSTYINPKENIGDLIHKMVFRKVAKLQKKKRAHSATSNKPIEDEPIDISPNVSQFPNPSHSPHAKRFSKRIDIYVRHLCLT